MPTPTPYATSEASTTADESSEPSDETATGPGRLERLATGALGGALLATGLRRRGLMGGAATLVGGVLAYRAVGGHRVRAMLSERLSGDPGGSSGAQQPEATASVTVRQSQAELRSFLQDPAHLDRVLSDVVSVTDAGRDRQRWSVRGPERRGPSWETRLEATEERLRWVPVEGPALFDAWTVTLDPAPGDRGTRVTLRVRFDPPGGRLGRGAMERLDVVPETLVAATLDRLQSLVETGDVPTLERNPSARGQGDLL